MFAYCYLSIYHTHYTLWSRYIQRDTKLSDWSELWQNGEKVSSRQVFDLTSWWRNQQSTQSLCLFLPWAHCSQKDILTQAYDSFCMCHLVELNCKCSSPSYYKVYNMAWSADLYYFYSLFFPLMECYKSSQEPEDNNSSLSLLEVSKQLKAQVLSHSQIPGKDSISLYVSFKDS